MSGDVFRALADPTRRALLDQLRTQDGQDLTSLAVQHQHLSRFAVAKHLAVLSAAGLVTVVPDGRHRRHHLNAVPLQELHSRWLGRYSASAAQALLDLRTHLEGPVEEIPVDVEPVTASQKTVFVIVIRSSADALWAALTQTGSSRTWMYDSATELRDGIWAPGTTYAMGVPGFDLITGTVLEADPPRRLVMTFDARWDEEVAAEPAGTLAYDVVEDRGACTLTVTVDGVSGATARSVSEDTPEIYSALKTHLETGHRLRDA